ncbi:uncharacterized protein LOC111905175 [Lactuca sativa]|uniref:DUF7642 domain-containing protein n=1 Tax=Lactuca sativa TaxID=4236 RepID=A0A9R1X3A2_LACSA|nr:uncharacterized protein LOC111905175 [Lactuca sativa]XP_023756627.1 uncharacterized protein LOC111905175 [Lactuca sativa]KAJ0197646.1 hypothetical protein LSAT_V11C700356840 [Lactuca sativa]
MESQNGGIGEIDYLEKGLLSDTREANDGEDDDEPILYSASFEEAEDDFIKLKTTQWILYSLLLILAWGFGLLMFLYIPVRRYILRRMIQSRKLYVTPNSIVYKVTKPVPFPCFGVLKKEKHVLLPSVADVVIEQGYLQSRFGVYSIRIENVGVRRPPSDDVQIEGIVDPRAFKKFVLMRLSEMRNQTFSRQVSTLEDASSSRNVQSYAAPMSPLQSIGRDILSPVGEFGILQKLEEVDNSLKRVQTLIEERQPKTFEHKD